MKILGKGSEESNRGKPLIGLPDAFLCLRHGAEVERFLRDVGTPQEIRALTERLHVAQLLWEGGHGSYRDIHEATGVSLATITRVARFLKIEPNKGYELVFERVLGETK